MNLTKKAALFGAVTLAGLGLAAGQAAMAGSVTTQPTGLSQFAADNVTFTSEVDVPFDSTAASGDFNGVDGSNTVGYKAYLGADSQNVYGLFQADAADLGGTYDSNLDFSNIYLSTDQGHAHSEIGFQLTNGNAFNPNNGTLKTLPSSDLTYQVDASTGTIEWRLPWTLFTNDTLGILAQSDNPLKNQFISPGDTLQLRLSQTFGYAVAGGSSFGGDRLGEVTFPTPEPASWAAFAFMGLGAMALMLKARKRKALDA